MIPRIMPRIFAAVAILLMLFSFAQADEGCTRSPCSESPQTEYDCLSLDGYWYDGVCHEEPACTFDNLDICETESQCESSGFYWYDGGCHAEAKRICSPSNLSGCVSENDCLNNGGEWHKMDGCPRSPCPSYECIPKQKCDRSHLSLCNSEETCKSLGYGYWYDGSCHSRPKPVCSPSNLAGCQNQEDCLENGGEWHNTILTNVVKCLPVSFSSIICELPLNSYFWNYQNCNKS